MGLENKALTPIPANKQMGEFVRIEKIYGGLKRLVRQFEVKAGDRLLPENIDSDVFDEYGLSDAETTATYNFDGQKSDITYENLYLEEQQVVGPGKSGGLPRLRQIYIEAYADELREVDKPIIDTDENGRRTTQRTFIVLNTASDAVKNGTIGTTADPDFENNLLSGERQTVGNSVTFIRRTYIEATDELVQVGKDDIGKTTNGFKTLTRIYIGTDSAPIGDEDVGVDTDTVDGTTVYLGGIDVKRSEGFSRVEKTWVEDGILNISTRDLSEGIQQVSTTFLAVEGDTVGPVTSRTTQNVEGLKTITVTTLQSDDGEDILGPGGSDKLVETRQQLVNWTRPGIAGLIQKEIPTELSENKPTAVELYQRSPAQVRLRAKIAIYTSSSPDITDADFSAITGGEATQFWNPPEWAVLEGKITDDFYVGVSANEPNRTLRGFRKIASGDENFGEVGTGVNTTADAILGGSLLLWLYPKWFGNYIRFQGIQGSIIASASITGGPERPEGQSWVIDIDNDEIASDLDGNKYYRKVFVWAYVPDFDAGEDIFDGP